MQVSMSERDYIKELIIEIEILEEECQSKQDMIDEQAEEIKRLKKEFDRLVDDTCGHFKV